MGNRTNHLRGPEHPSWRGDAASYSALHAWVRRHKPKPDACEHCGTDGPLEWANKSHEYRRDLDDWLALCRRCHRAYDRSPVCPNGHERTPATTRIDRRGIAKCRPCANVAWRRRYYEKQGRAVPA